MYFYSIINGSGKGTKMKINWRRLNSPASGEVIKKSQSNDSKEKPLKPGKYNRKKFDMNKYLNNLRPDNF
ncbi:MAG TPA: hypothetical protein VLB50_12030 [Ignavibacteriaceae bacterium]|nr:hypothetical protein [Ignavibacteriaceae bacterium]